MACNITVLGFGLALMAGVACFSPAWAEESFEANLGPMPLDAALRASIQGRGEVTAVANGMTLTIRGTFGGLTSPATEARAYVSSYIGVPGQVQPISLTVSPSASGTLTGTAALTGQQAAALRAGRFYIALSSRDAPSGNLWGWLLPAHEDEGPNEPQRGDWFQPHIGAPLRWHATDPMGQH